MASTKDYYKTLGVSESVSVDEIKRSYRTLAKKYHPDANPNNKAAEEKFKELSEAYYVLSDPGKRREYDAFKKGGFSSGGRQGYGGGGQGFQGAQGFDFEEILKMFSAGGGPASGGRRGGARTHFRSSMGGFQDIFSSGGSEEDTEEYAPAKVSSDASATLKISKSRAQKGGEVSFTAKEGKKITVRIPPGITSGKKLRLARQGNLCPTCDHPGDLILTIKMEA